MKPRMTMAKLKKQAKMPSNMKSGGMKMAKSSRKSGMRSEKMMKDGNY